MTFKWIAYGLEMKEDVIKEFDGENVVDSHKKMIQYLQENNVPFDSCHLYDEGDSD